MIEPLENLPDGVIGFKAVGTVEPDDYRNVLDPAIEAAGGDLRLVFVVGDDFDRYSLGAIWQDTKLGASHSPKYWKRVAMVTNHDWLAHAVSLFSSLLPGEAKVFAVDQQDAAIAWAAEAD
jgi:hypothetical protein